MTRTSIPAAGSAVVVPLAVRLSVAGWLTAVAAGVGEALVRTVLPDPPTLGRLASRFAIYAVVVALVLALPSGRNAVRWALAVLLGGIGMLSLVVEPLSWLFAGGSAAEFLTTATGPTLLIAGLRVAHVIAVVAALVLMFRPRANAFFRNAPTPMVGASWVPPQRPPGTDVGAPQPTPAAGAGPTGCLT